MIDYLDWKMDEDVLQFTCDNGKIIDVGYYPAFDPNGEYRCVLISEPTPEAWTKPEMVFRTKSYDEAIAWAESFRDQQ